MARIRAAARTHIGRRASNEDAYLTSPEHGLYVVADGMGGYEGGEVASELVIEAMEQFFDEHAEDDGLTWPWGREKGLTFEENLLGVSIRLAHRAVEERRHGALSQMGSTVAATLEHGDELVLAHVGDSRVYRFRDGELVQLTRDHSVLNQMREMEVELHEAMIRQYENMITRALGFESGEDLAELTRARVQPGDMFLLCTDGLHGALGDPQIRALLEQGGSPEEIAGRLVDAAFVGGGTDNITVVVLSVPVTP